ncbi:MAG: YbaK/EbsC family protein [Roseovarius sp.]
MSKSLKRVIAALSAGGEDVTPREVGQATTAQMAADLVGCEIDQIAKSIIFAGSQSGAAILFITAGGRQVDGARASALVGETLTRADAAQIRAQTGFAIGGVSPIGHLTPPRAFFDPRLMEFAEIWAAAGTPRHLFGAPPREVLRLSSAQLAEFTA